MSASRQYELVYILPAEMTEQEVADLHTQVDTVTQRFSGTVEKTENWGRRKLAYEIGPHKEGIYVLETLAGPGEMVKELDRRLKVNDKVVRHLVVRIDEEQRVAERLRARRQEETARRRAARGLPAEETPAEVPASAGEPASEQAEG